ncbi:MAG: S41 family peptidase, partial [Defluviitaleaceae bacterium]|nr:S41 family peptidase [Defluviitaleaceae bacterium]
GGRWLHILTGDIIPPNNVRLTRFSLENQLQSLRNSTPEIWFYIPLDKILLYSNPVSFDETHTIQGRIGFSDELIPNDKLIIMLTDRLAGSAGESFVDLMFSMENTLVMGQNTGGVLNTDGRYSNLSLPNSGILFGLGRAVILHPEGHLIEGVGIAPDIWVRGDALQAALALISNNR